jgi:hypothetical protein
MFNPVAPATGTQRQGPLGSTEKLYCRRWALAFLDV